MQSERGVVFLFKQKTAYEMRISDWSSDVCSSDLRRRFAITTDSDHDGPIYPHLAKHLCPVAPDVLWVADISYIAIARGFVYLAVILDRSEEHTSELQSLMRISYAVFCLKKKKQKKLLTNDSQNTIKSNRQC